MFTYYMGIVDFYTGMVEVEDYINLLLRKDDTGEINLGHSYLSEKELKHFLIRCLMELFKKESYWEGDIATIAISAIPRPTAASPYMMAVVKQYSNGSSFLISECAISYNNDKEDYEVSLLSKDKNYTQDDLLKWFYKSYDLVEYIFKRASTEKLLLDESMSDFEKIS